MSGLPKRARRALRQRGVRSFVDDSLTYAAESKLVPLIDDYFESRALTETDLATICEAEGTLFDYYDRGESYVLELPTVAGGYPEPVRDETDQRYGDPIRIDPPYVCALADAELVGPDAVALKNDGYVFENSLQSPGRLTTSCLLSIAHGTVPRGTREGGSGHDLDVAVSLVGPWTNNYTHWFQDYLARLEGVEHYRERTGTTPQIIVPATASTWMRDALRATGFDPETWYEWHGGRLSVDRLLVPSIRREARNRAAGRRIVYSPSGIEWVSDRIKRNIDPESTREHSSRIFISRANALTRRVTNEEETMALLGEWGFQRYRTEELSFAEQVTLFSEADVIVAPHGSGLMNQIFGDDLTIIELFGPKQGVTEPATEYYYAELLGYDYGCVQGETVGPDIHVDHEELETLLDAMVDK